MEHTIGFEETDKGQALVVYLSGEIDHHSAAPLKRALDSALSESDEKICILDMTHVSLMYSSGLGILLGRYNIMCGRGGVLIIRNPNKTIDTILRMSGIYSIINVIRK